ncbi:hypothetical protein [Actinopolymorpha cephalotaxi]|uniref:Uncharacterized protein n=1 Tax=Actinopolymorpha cephalotaxi TaxID=504797 RepID=A0ABX2SA09_9ACTN|nr:hypothetical protein [Actinopolymorpha cephalotaxi]NYH85107.1 hypothetical protein [Actinopolymorpha cephalotaxi]
MGGDQGDDQYEQQHDDQQHGDLDAQRSGDPVRPEQPTRIGRRVTPGSDPSEPDAPSPPADSPPADERFEPL